MNFRKKEEDEPTLFKLRTSRKAYLYFYLMILILVILIYIVFTYKISTNVYLIYGAIIFGVLILKGTEFHRINSYYSITPHYVIYSNGIINTDVTRIYIPTISDIVVKQNLWKRLLNFGDLRIHRYSKGAIIEMKSINNPNHYARILEEKLNTTKRAE
jgi:uncharacterized membrane protein YdbT with pleckstrin-like domain